MEKIKIVLSILYKIIDKIFFYIRSFARFWINSKGLYLILSVVMIFTVIFVPIAISMDYSKALKEFATINITIAIGIVATILTINKEYVSKEDIWIPLIQIIIGALSYFFGLVNNELLSRVYLILNGISVVTAVTVTGGLIAETSKVKANMKERKPMRRDMEYAIKLMSDIYKGSYRTGSIPIEVEDDITTEEVEENIKYIEHLKLLEDANYIERNISYFDCTPHILELRLTWDGNDFLDMIENDNLWNKTKAAAKEKGFEIAKMPLDLIVALTKSKAKEILGLDV